MRRIATIGDGAADLELQQRCDRIIRTSNVCTRCDGKGHLRGDPDKPHYPWTPENSECDRCRGTGTTWRLSRDLYRR
jgi:DnaJ-class molecular chaperone